MSPKRTIKSTQTQHDILQTTYFALTFQHLPSSDALS